jgi:cytochrome oxidase Cu insertion factor (SCO1/SenC/PrrC family)
MKTTSFLLVVPVFLAACESQPEVRPEGFRGAGVSPPVPKVDFSLVDQTGSRFSFREETDGFATLLFDERFIGLTGPIDQINEILLQMDFRPGSAQQGPEENYGVSHSSAVVGYTRDNVGRFFYLGGTRTEDYVNDIPLLVRFSGAD